MSGKLIVIEGADGSGKATQVALLVENLRVAGQRVETIDFPQYKNNLLGWLLRECLDGRHGDFLSLDPKIISVLYAVDRFESSGQIRAWLEEGAVVVLDRYASSNMLHQAAKIVELGKRAEFLDWLNRLEYEVLGIPRPDLVLYLEMPYEVRRRLMERDSARGALDVAEVDTTHQMATEAAAQTAISRGGWQKISCVREGQMRLPEEIQSDIMEVIKMLIK